MVILTEVDGSNQQGTKKIKWGGGEIDAKFIAETDESKIVKATFSIPEGPYRLAGDQILRTWGLKYDLSGGPEVVQSLSIVRLDNDSVPRVDVHLTVVEVEKVDSGWREIGTPEPGGPIVLTPPLTKPRSLAAARPVSMGEALKRRRRQLGMSQRAVAEHVGLHPSTISRVERGLSCSDGTCSKIEKIL